MLRRVTVVWLEMGHTCRQAYNDSVFLLELRYGRPLPTSMLCPPTFSIRSSKNLVLLMWEKSQRKLFFSFPTAELIGTSSRSLCALVLVPPLSM